MRGNLGFSLSRSRCWRVHPPSCRRSSSWQEQKRRFLPFPFSSEDVLLWSAVEKISFGTKALCHHFSWRQGQLIQSLAGGGHLPSWLVSVGPLLRCWWQVLGPAWSSPASHQLVLLCAAPLTPLLHRWVLFGASQALSCDCRCFHIDIFASSASPVSVVWMSRLCVPNSFLAVTIVSVPLRLSAPPHKTLEVLLYFFQKWCLMNAVLIHISFLFVLWPAHSHLFIPAVSPHSPVSLCLCCSFIFIGISVNAGLIKWFRTLWNKFCGWEQRGISCFQYR